MPWRVKEVTAGSIACYQSPWGTPGTDQGGRQAAADAAQRQIREARHRPGQTVTTIGRAGAACKRMEGSKDIKKAPQPEPERIPYCVVRYSVIREALTSVRPSHTILERTLMQPKPPLIAS